MNDRTLANVIEKFDIDTNWFSLLSEMKDEMSPSEWTEIRRRILTEGANIDSLYLEFAVRKGGRA